MRRLSALDAAFWLLDGPTTPMHAMGVAVLDAPPGWGATELRRVLAHRMGSLEPLRWRIVDPPPGAGRPVAVDGGAPDLTIHVTELDAGGRPVAAVVGELAGTPLDVAGPPWRIDVIRGAAEGTAVCARFHHAIADGMAAVELLGRIVDLEPTDPPAGEPPPLAGEAPPDPTVLYGDALGEAARDALAVFDGLLRTATGAVMLSRTGAAAGAGRPFPPPAPTNGVLSARRLVALGSASMEAVDARRDGTGATVNDVVLAAVAGAMRRWLHARGVEASGPLVAAVPASVRAGEHADAAANLIASVFVELPVDEDDPRRRLERVRSSAAAAKAAHAALGGGWLLDLARLVPAGTPRGVGAALAGLIGTVAAARPVAHLSVSNVPGPPVPLWIGGARVEAVHPFGPLLPGCGCNITVMSYRGRLGVGVLVCPDVVGDPDPIARFIVDELAGAPGDR